MANTTYQNIIKKYKAIVTGNLVKGPAATLQDHFETGGTFVCNGTTPVTVADANFTNIAQVITISLNTVGGTVGGSAGVPPLVLTVTAGTGFTVAGQTGDSSIYNYLIH